MVAGDGIIWASLLIMAVGHSFHRMGPSFERSRFGYPLVLLGFTCLILFPEDLTLRGSDLHTAILRAVWWTGPFAIGSLLILRFAPTYGRGRPLGLAAGWLVIGLSWAILYSLGNPISLSGTIEGLLVLMGVLVSLLAVIIGVTLSARSSGLRNESEPLSNEEEGLVRTILERRLEREGHGN